MKFFKNFKTNEAGAVSVDWVVLTSALCGICIAAYTVIESETTDLSSDIAATIENADVSGLAAGAGLGTSGGDS